MAVPSRWQDWTLPTGGALVSMLLAGLWFMRLRKPQDTPQAAAVPAGGSPRVAPVAAGALAEMPRQPAQASVSETDVLEAADIYLTYGRREEALDVLQRGIERAPEQLDLRLRYLGLLAESGDVEGYRGAADGFLQAGGSPFLLQQVLALHPALAAAVAPVEPAPAPLAFTLDEPSASVARRSAPPLAEPPTLADADAIAAEDSALWLDDFDEVLTLGELPTLLGQPDAPATPPAAEALRQLEPNPQHLVRLNQAVAYIKQGDMDSACCILESLATEGDEQQRRQVSELLAQIA
jgi:pilus assembly protein FimV